MTYEQVKLTLCFYEHPGAVSEIDHWERGNRDCILSKRLDGRLTLFTLGESKPDELLACIPLDALNGAAFAPNVLDDRIRAHAEEETGTSHFRTVKYLIFGRVERADLDRIAACMEHPWAQPVGLPPCRSV